MFLLSSICDDDVAAPGLLERDGRGEEKYLGVETSGYPRHELGNSMCPVSPARRWCSGNGQSLIKRDVLPLIRLEKRNGYFQNPVKTTGEALSNPPKYDKCKTFCDKRSTQHPRS